MLLIPFKAVPISSVNDLNKTIKRCSEQMTQKEKANNPKWEGQIFELYRKRYYSKEQWEKDSIGFDPPPYPPSP